MQIYGICAAIFVALGVYSAIWIKKVMETETVQASAGSSGDGDGK